MIKLGITGGIGSGKSIVASFLQSTGIPVYNADDEAKRITATSVVVRKQLIHRFGPLLYVNEKLNKPFFASLIFKNKENLKDANAIIHPEVLHDFLSWAEKQKLLVVAIETAILFESGFNDFVDHILTVTAPVELRIDRVMKRSNLSRESVLERISNQISDEWKIKHSDWVVYNDGVQPIIPQMEKIMSAMLLPRT